MIYTSEDTTGALLRDVAKGRLDLAIVFCAPTATADVELTPLREEDAIVHLPSDHPLASRPRLTLAEIADETILVAASRDSAGFTDRVVRAFAELGITPRTRTDPYPDLGVQAVRERLGVVIYARSAFPDRLHGSAFVPVDPPLTLPFQLATRTGPGSASLQTVREIADSLSVGPPPDGFATSDGLGRGPAGQELGRG